MDLMRGGCEFSSLLDGPLQALIWQCGEAPLCSCVEDRIIDCNYV